MKILFITDLYPVSKKEKTTPRTLLNFVQEWEKSGHTVDVIKPNFILNSFLRGKPFYKTGLYGNVFNINFLTPFWKVKPLKDNYDLVIAHMPSGILYADKTGVSFVAGIHNSDIEVLTKPLYKFYFKKRLERALYNAKAIACRSFVIKNKLLKLYPEFETKTFVAPSGIDESIINPSTFQLSSSYKILTCANLIKRKNIDKLILACKGIQDVELTVIGDGKEKKYLEKLDKEVIFTGRLERERVYAKMRESDIFILPSINETFGMVYLEAMSQGCITVCTQNDGISGIIKDGENGFLTEPDAESIKKTILRIKNLSTESIQKVQQNAFDTLKFYTSKRVAQNYLQQIFNIL